LAPYITDERLRDKSYDDSLIPAVMNVWLKWALTANGENVKSQSYLIRLSMENFVSSGWLFNRWQGNYSWKKLCPSAGCQGSIDAKFVPIPSPAVNKMERTWSEDEKASRNEYMIHYHWKDSGKRHPSWIVQCPLCHVNIKAKLNRCAFAAYDMVCWEVADQRDLQDDLLRDDGDLIEFGDSQTFFNQLILTQPQSSTTIKDANVEKA